MPRHGMNDYNGDGDQNAIGPIDYRVYMYTGSAEYQFEKHALYHQGVFLISDTVAGSHDLMLAG